MRPDACVSVVLAAKGYPDAPEAGAEIEGVEAASELEGVSVFHAGTRREGDSLVVSGGRVLNVSATAHDLAAARERAYEAAGLIRFDGMQRRSDIGEVAAHV